MNRVPHGLLQAVFTVIIALFLAHPVVAAGGHGADSYQKTVWSEKTELFMEYDPPVTGKLGGFLLHLTDLKTFKPVSDARVTLSLTSSDGKVISSPMPFTGRPGIYQGTISPTGAGAHRFSLSVAGEGFNDTVAYDGLIVRQKGEAASEEGGHASSEGNIPFLKEQQWAVEFSVREVNERNMASMLTVTGELAANPTAEALLSAPLAGMVAFDRPIAHIGQRVSKGDELCHIEPPVFQDGGVDQLAAQVGEARSRVLLAQKEVDRARRLVEGKAAPRKRLEEAEIMLKIAEANLAPLSKALGRVQSGSSCRHLIMKAPISGTVVDVSAANGAYVQAGQPLLRVVDTSKLWLKANIPVAESSHLDHLTSAHFTISGMDREFQPTRLVTVNDVIDPQTRTVQTILEVGNPDSMLKIGMFATIYLQAGLEERILAVPNSAVFEDEGKYFVYVQTGGETFARREVTLGNKDTGFTAVTQGLNAGDHVVVTGGYYVKQASQAGKTPEGHGHEH